MIWLTIISLERKSRGFIQAITTTTYEYLSIQRIDLGQNDRNANIINFIDAIYVETENTTILEWLQSMLEFISTIASRDANLDQETLWITKKYFLDSFHFLSKIIMGGQKT